ncbi:MAG TPA: TIM44-like domain-containing protein [Candidatus Dormibacteraeota bacterium]
MPAIPATAEARQPALDAAVQQLRAADPTFDVGAFMEEISRRFAWQKQALADRSPGLLAGQASPALLERWKDDAARQLTAGVRTEYRGLRVDGVRPIWLTVGPARDRFTVAVDHTAAITGVADDSGQVVFGGSSPSAKVEYWTLSRPTGAVTPDPESGASCPGCGAPVNRNRGPVCPYCRAEVPSALLGWLLDRVDDAIEWAQVAMPVDPEDERRKRELEQEDDWLDAQLRGQGH